MSWHLISRFHRSARALAAGGFFLAVVGTSGGQATGSGLSFDEPHRWFGDRYQGQTVRQQFRFTNRGQRPVRVVERVDVRGSAEIEVDPTTISPGESGTVSITQPLSGLLGQVGFRYAVITDEPGGPRYRMTLSGFVQSAFDPEVPRVLFGMVDRAAGGRVEFELFSREVPRLVLVSVGEPPSFLRLEEIGRAGVADEGLRLRATLTPGAPLGHLAGTLRLRTNVDHQPEVRVPFEGAVFDDVFPSESPVQFGLAYTGGPLTKRLVLESRSGRPFRVDRVVDSNGKLEATATACGGEERAAAACQEIELSWPEPTAGALRGTLRIELVDPAVPLELSYVGLVVSAGTPVERLGGESPPAGDTER